MSTERALVRLPLQVGTTATWAMARAAIALAPGLALTIVGVWSFPKLDSGELSVAILVSGVLLVVYAGYYLRLAMRTRASDLLVFRDRLRVEGGSRHGMEIAWSELRDPWSGVTEGRSERLILWKVPLTAIAAVGGEGVDPTSKLPVWRLWVKREGNKDVHLAETDRADEAKSFRAAAATIGAITSGTREVEDAKQLGTDHASCSNCSAPLVPEDAPQVECRYCHETVDLAPEFRERAKSIKSMEGSRARAKRMIEKLVRQPGAMRANVWLVSLALLMFAAWPVGWWAFARHVIHDGFKARDLAYFFLPIAGVLGCFLFARGRLADRRAMQLLTLSYGALAPAKKGEPARCRRCIAPLPAVGIGGVATCMYCQAESIVGIDLRPVIDRARKEDDKFERALAVRRRELLKWGALTAVSLAVLAAWIVATFRYIKH